MDDYDDWDYEPDLVVGQGDGLGRSDSEDRIPILETLTEPIGFGRDKEWWTMQEKTILEIVAAVFEELEDEEWFEIFCELIEVILINYVIFFLVKKGEDIFREVF